jgi:FkbM family methyltransferase
MKVYMIGISLVFLIFLVSVVNGRGIKKIIKYPFNNATAIVEIPPQFSKFWSRVEKGEWEASTLSIFSQVITKDTLVIDFGAWIGPTILFAGHFAQQVIGLEPNPEAFKLVKKNVDMNHDDGRLINVDVFHKCISVRTEQVRMRYGPESAADSMGSVVSLDDAAKEDQAKRSGGVSRVKGLNPLHQQPVECYTLEEAIQYYYPIVIPKKETTAAALPPLFIKVDIEGYESNLVGTWVDWVDIIKPTMFLSMHQQTHFSVLWDETKRKSVINTLKKYPYVYEVADCGQKVRKVSKDCNGGLFKVVNPGEANYILCEKCDYLLSFLNHDHIKI